MVNIGDKYIVEVAEVSPSVTEDGKYWVLLKGNSPVRFLVSSRALSSMEKADTLYALAARYEKMDKRLRHLLQNKCIASFDEIDPKTGNYKKSIEEFKDYEQGLNDAWEAARKICTNGVISDTSLGIIFGKETNIDEIMNSYSPAEAIAKIKAYEDKQNEIKVGDELKFSSVATEGRLIIGIVFEITKYSDGNWAYHLWTPFELNKNYVLIKSDFSKRLVGKTGKHYPHIEELLKAVKGE